MSDKAAVAQPASVPTPPGYNKKKRDLSKVLLAMVSFCLLSGIASNVAVLLSAASTLVMKQGTMTSIKNIKWMVLSVISFVASLLSTSFLGGQKLLDEDKAYELKFKLWFEGKMIQTVWGGILALFIFAAYQSEEPNNAKLAMQQAKLK